MIYQHRRRMLNSFSHPMWFPAECHGYVEWGNWVNDDGEWHGACNTGQWEQVDGAKMRWAERGLGLSGIGWGKVRKEESGGKSKVAWIPPTALEGWIAIPCAPTMTANKCACQPIRVCIFKHVCHWQESVIILQAFVWTKFLFFSGIWDLFSGTKT